MYCKIVMIILDRVCTDFIGGYGNQRQEKCKFTLRVKLIFILEGMF